MWCKLNFVLRKKLEVSERALLTRPILDPKMTKVAFLGLSYPKLNSHAIGFVFQIIVWKD